MPLLARFPAALLLGLLLTERLSATDFDARTTLDSIFDDRPRTAPLDYPDWFRLSLLDLPADLEAARSAGRRGLIVYIGQAYCAYCHRLVAEDFGRADIRDYLRRHFEVVPMDIAGEREVTDFDGSVVSEREFARRAGIDFMPTLLFYGPGGRLALRLRGYYPPYQLLAALEYVADGHDRHESFQEWLARGENRMTFDATDLNPEPFFAPPPFDLDRRRPGQRPLVVFFEQGDCHACDLLHGQILRQPEFQRAFARLDAVQLDRHAATPVITPAGERTQARAWADALGLFYTPSLLFFDERGRELLRLDSVAGFYRLGRVLEFLETRVWPWELSRNHSVPTDQPTASSP